MALKTVRDGAVAGLGLAVGAILGFLAYAALSLMGDPNQGLRDLLLPVTGTRAVFVATGATFGLLAFAELGGVLTVRPLLRLLTGALAGSVAGLVLYAVGYVAAHYGDVPLGHYTLLLVLEAFYSFTVVEVFCVGLGAAVGFLMVKYTWRFYGILTYVALVAVVVGYLLYAITISLPRVGTDQLPLSLMLLVTESASLTMVVVYAFYSLDVFVRKRWRRGPEQVPFSRYYLPKVAFHVTVFNEPTDMVKETLAHLMRVDYPEDRFTILVLDDSTDDALRRDLKAFCERHGLTHVHREDRRGYKAGALNNALKHTPSDVELISVIDADYQVEPDYLKETVGYFINPNLGFVQTPQDYRNVHQSFLTEQYYYADGYFYRAVLPSRNEENTIIFCGTMGLIRKATLEDVGGWGEDYITEDSELSIRILERGWESLYVNKTFGRGLIPPTYEGYKSQLYRWSFGGVKILTGHIKELFLSRLTLRQKFDFLVGNLHWFDGIFIVAISAALAIIAAGDIAGSPVITYHQRELWLIGLVPLFLLIDGVTRLHLALKRSMNLPLGATLKVMGMWYAIKFNNMFASLKALSGSNMAFVRTPKAPEDRPGRLEAARRAMGLAKFETAAFLTLTILAWQVTEKTMHIKGPIPAARLLLAFWLLHYALIYLCAPLYAYKAYMTFVPDEDLVADGERGVLEAGPRRAVPEGEPSREA